MYNIAFRSFCSTADGWIHLKGDIEAPQTGLSSFFLDFWGHDDDDDDDDLFEGSWRSISGRGGAVFLFCFLFSPFEGRIMITIIVMVIISYMKGNAEAP